MSTILGPFAPTPSVVVGHREHANGRSGGRGFTMHIRDVYFSRYLDCPSLTPLSHTYPPFPEEVLRLSGHLLTRLRKPIASQCIPHVRLLVPVI